MSKFIQALLSGIFFTFILDFFIFLGIKLNYINFYEIDVYYNILFADHQNLLIFSAVSLILGIIIIYLNNKISVSVMSVLFLLVLSTLIHDIGYLVGEKMLMKKNVTLYDSRYSYTGDIYYDGRKTITFYDYELDKIITLKKDKLKKSNTKKDNIDAN